MDVKITYGEKNIKKIFDDILKHRVDELVFNMNRVGQEWNNTKDNYSDDTYLDTGGK